MNSPDNLQNLTLVRTRRLLTMLVDLTDCNVYQNLSISIESSLPPAPCPVPKPSEEGDGRSTRSSTAWSSISDWK